MPTYTVATVKTFEGMDGQGYNATLARDGKTVASVCDEGRGGAVIFRWSDRIEDAAFTAYCLSLPREAGSDARTPEVVMCELIAAFETRKRLQRLMKTKIVFINEGKPLMYAVKPGQPRGQLIDQLRARYPAVQILNALPIDESAPLAFAAGI